MTIEDLKPTEFAPYYSGYVSKIPKDTSLIDCFEEGLKTVTNFFKSIPSEKQHYKYADGKWTVKEVFQHIIDTERVFMYRCFRIARHDQTALSGFEQNAYIQPSKANGKSMDALIAEYQSVKKCFMVLLNSLTEEDLKYKGTASGNAMTARAAAFIAVGHEIWHVDIIKERYL